MRVAFVIKALANPGGGAERVLCQVAGGLAARKHDVAIVTSDAPAAKPFYPVPRSVGIVNAGVGNVARHSTTNESLRRIGVYRRLLRSMDPDVVVGVMHSSYLPVGLALLGTGIPLIASEHAGPEHYARHPVDRVLLSLTPLVSVRTTVVSDQVRQAFAGWLRRRMVVVPNPVVVGHAKDAVVPGGERKVLLSVGRLIPEKGHATLVRAFARLTPRHPGWILRIAGEGDQRSELEALVAALGITGRVELPGAVADIDDEYRAAELFVMPSLYESFGLATAEALLHGLPAIGFADCAGTNELIEDGVNGRLVYGTDRVGALAEAVDALMGRPDERARLARTPRESLVARFGLVGVLDQWESLLAAVRR